MGTREIVETGIAVVLGVGAVAIAYGRLVFSSTTEQDKDIGPVRGTFRIPLLPWSCAVLLAVSLPVLTLVALAPHRWRAVAADQAHILVPGFFFAAVVAGLGWRAMTLRVGSNGIELYRINKVLWSEVRAARLQSFFWLPYLRVWRHRGRPWFVPLYYVVGSSNLRRVLAESAPAGNEIRRCLESQPRAAR